MNKSATLPTDLVFNSRKVPGSVIVYRDKQPVAMIVVSQKDTPHMKKGMRFALSLYGRIDAPRSQRALSIPPGTYAQVKAALIQALDLTSAEGASK